MNFKERFANWVTGGKLQQLEENTAALTKEKTGYQSQITALQEKCKRVQLSADKYLFELSGTQEKLARETARANRLKNSAADWESAAHNLQFQIDDMVQKMEALANSASISAKTNGTVKRLVKGIMAIAKPVDDGQKEMGL